MADSIYWSNPGDNTIQGAPLAGGGTVETLYGSAQEVSGPAGLAIDPARGRIYWSNGGDHTIRRAPLTPGGTVETLYGPAQGVSGPAALAIDPAAGRIYWSNTGDGTILRAPLVPGGTVETLYGPPAQGIWPSTSLAIDPATGRIYWGDGSAGTIRRAPLTPGGTVDPLYVVAQYGGPIAVAIDPAAGRIYWSNWWWPGKGTIGGAPLAGSGTIDTLYDPGRGVNVPSGVAIDPNPAGPAAIVDERFTERDWLRTAFGWARDLFPRPSGSPGRIYWSNTGDGTIRSAPLAGGGTVDTLHGPLAPAGSFASGLALLRAPIGTVPPAISWGFVWSGDPFGELGRPPFGEPAHLERTLSCSPGTWAADLLGSRLYRAPESFAYQWRRDSTDIGGATAANYTPTGPGSYSCRVTATNRAGSAAQTSAAVTVSP